MRFWGDNGPKKAVYFSRLDADMLDAQPIADNDKTCPWAGISPSHRDIGIIIHQQARIEQHHHGIITLQA